MSMPSHAFNHVLIFAVGHSLINVKIEEMSLEGIGFILDGLDYLYMGLTVEFPASVTQLSCNSCDGGIPTQ